jgi:penicillin-binding protein-related factor A (putative recombinase)
MNYKYVILLNVDELKKNMFERIKEKKGFCFCFCFFKYLTMKYTISIKMVINRAGEMAQSAYARMFLAFTENQIRVTTKHWELTGVNIFYFRGFGMVF